MIADPLWSCVMLLCGPLQSFVGPLQYLVIPRTYGATQVSGIGVLATLLLLYVGTFCY